MKDLREYTIFEINKELNNRGYIGPLWCIEDIKHQATEDNINLSDNKAKEVLNYIGDKHDATNGINWDTISSAILVVINK